MGLGIADPVCVTDLHVRVWQWLSDEDTELWHGLQELCCAHVVILVRSYTHGGWAHRQRVTSTFFTRKNSQILLVLLTVFEPRSFGSRVRRSTY